MLSVSVAAALMAPVCSAALTWKTQRIGFTAKSSDKVAVGQFQFTNTGATDVTITSVKTDCGCTAAELIKHTYSPGETGEIKATFTFEGRVGEHQKTIQVLTDESAKPAELVLQVNIAELLTCSPRLLLWRLGEEAVEKAAVIVANGTTHISSIDFKASTPADITPRLETIEAGKKYRLVVLPASTGKAAQTTLECVAHFADGTSQDFSVFALIR